MLEKVIERYVINYARRRKILVTKLNLKGFRGMPDDCFWFHGGRPTLMEFKTLDGELSRAQIRVIKQLKELQYDVQVVRTKEHGVQIIEEKLEAARLSKSRKKVPNSE